MWKLILLLQFEMHVPWPGKQIAYYSVYFPMKCSDTIIYHDVIIVGVDHSCSQTEMNTSSSVAWKYTIVPRVNTYSSQ